MKKAILYIICTLAGIIVGAAALFLLFRFTGAGAAFLQDEGNLSVRSDSSKNHELTALAFEIAGYMEEGDYKALSKTVHPDYGVVISPYSTVTLASNQCFTARDVARFGTDKTAYIWGLRDGTGEPIQMTPEDFFARYIFNVNYSNSSLVGVDYIVKSGNSLENVTEVFPGAHFVDLNYPGTEANSYADWSTLRLVFEDYGGTLMLSAIIHSQATL